MNNSIILQNVTTETLAELIQNSVNSAMDKLAKTDNVELLTREQACAFLQIDSSTLWHWTNKGKVIAYGIGNRRYYKKSELLNSLIPLKK